MANRYLFWLRTTAVLQIITSAIHAISFFRSPPSETAQLDDLMATARPDVGPYFHPTQGHILLAFSACFSFLYFFGGMTLLYLLQKNLSAQIWKGLTSICLLVFGATFVVMLLFSFLTPIILTGLVFFSLCFAYATNHIHHIQLPKD